MFHNGNMENNEREWKDGEIIPETVEICEGLQKETNRRKLIEVSEWNQERKEEISNNGCYTDLWAYIIQHFPPLKSIRHY